MKKRMKDVLLICITILCFLTTGCRQDEMGNAEADDAISEAIYAELGDALYYREGNKDEERNIWRYAYMIHDYEAEDVIASVRNTVQKVIEEEGLDENIIIHFIEEVSGDDWEVVALISNFMPSGSTGTRFDGMEYLYIRGTKESIHNDTSPYNEPSTYFNIEGIKHLEIGKKINEIATEEGIDWYEVFPDLEEFFVNNY